METLPIHRDRDRDLDRRPKQKPRPTPKPKEKLETHTAKLSKAEPVANVAGLWRKEEPRTNVGALPPESEPERPGCFQIRLMGGFDQNGRRLFDLLALASACSVQIHRLIHLDRRLITVDPVDVGICPARIGVLVPFHPRASGEDASLKGSRNRRFGDLCGMSAVEQRSSKIDQFIRVRDHVTTSARLNFTRAKHLRAAFGSVTVRDRLSHSQPIASAVLTAIAFATILAVVAGWLP